MHNGKVMSILMLALSNYLTDFVEIWYLLEYKHRNVWPSLYFSSNEITLLKKSNFIFIVDNDPSYNIFYSSKYR
jgi:hypothetical protein